MLLGALLLVWGGPEVATGEAGPPFWDLPPGLLPGLCGGMTSDPRQTVEGKGSWEAAYRGTGRYQLFLITDRTLVSLRPGTAYKVSFRYRILETPDLGFSVMFTSEKGSGLGGPPLFREFKGKAGDRGEVQLTARLGAFDDYRVAWHIVGRGALAVDTLRIVDQESGAAVLSADFEDPALVPGSLGFRITGTRQFPIGTQGARFGLRSAAAADLTGDGAAEVVVTVTGYPGQPPRPVMVLGTDPQVADLAPRIFPRGVPSVRHSPYTFFRDLDGDGTPDLVLSEAGMDEPPFTGARLVTALGNGDGTWEDVSPQIPRELWGLRSYATAVGDLDGDGLPEVLVPAQTTGVGSSALSFRGRTVTARKDWIPPELWTWPGKLCLHISLDLDDLDGDGWTDLAVGGTSGSPTLRIAFGGPAGFSPRDLVTLPDGTFGHFDYADWGREEVRRVQGADVTALAVFDADHDGLKDLFLIQQQIVQYKPGAFADQADSRFRELFESGGTWYGDNAVRILKNRGNRQFTEVVPLPRGSLGRRDYLSLVPVDLNQDGYQDLVGGFSSQQTARTPFGTTVFLNDRQGGFRVIEGEDLFPQEKAGGSSVSRQIGAFVPTAVTGDGLEGLFLSSSSDLRSSRLLVRRGVSTVRAADWDRLAALPELAGPGRD